MEMVYPGGISAISRWLRSLSDATTGPEAQHDSDPEGVADREYGCDPSGVNDLRDSQTPGDAALARG